MTGVPVMPSGSMLPHGKVESGTGRPNGRTQISRAELASIA